MIHKVFQIIEALTEEKDNTLSSISQATGIPRSTVHRLLTMLAEEGIVTFFPKKGYVLTPKLLSLSLKGLGQKDLLDIAVPIMREIEGLTKEAVSLTVISGIERVCIHRLEGEYPITRNIRIGDKGPLFIGAAGKVLAAGLGDKEISNIITKYIAEGIIEEKNVPHIWEEVRKTRERGHAVSREERLFGCASIAVPIYDFSGQVQAALSLPMPVERLNEDISKTYIDLLKKAAGQISVQLGHTQ